MVSHITPLGSPFGRAGTPTGVPERALSVSPPGCHLPHRGRQEKSEVINMKIPLSDRLLACCNFVKRGDRVADIGCDHGYLGIHLLQQLFRVNGGFMAVNVHIKILHTHSPYLDFATANENVSSSLQENFTIGFLGKQSVFSRIYERNRIYRKNSGFYRRERPFVL